MSCHDTEKPQSAKSSIRKTLLGKHKTLLLNVIMITIVKTKKYEQTGDKCRKVLIKDRKWNTELRKQSKQSELVRLVKSMEHARELRDRNQEI